MKLKWQREGTGGNCDALVADLPNGDYIMITAHDDATVPRRGEPVDVGWYAHASGCCIDAPEWATAAAENTPECAEESLLFPNVTTAKRVLADGYKQEN